MDETRMPQTQNERQGFKAPDYDHSIHSNPDAQAWAQFFCETAKELIHEGRDPQKLLMDCPWMLSWFANAMMAMHDWMLQNGYERRKPNFFQRVSLRLKSNQLTKGRRASRV